MGMDQGRGPATVSDTEVIEGLNDLLQLDHDAIGAYQIAIEKLDDPDWKSQISGYLRDHERHVRELNDAIAELGGTPTNEPHMTGPFKEALQSLGALGGDKGVLVAWRTNELQVRTKYDAYASKAVFWPDRVKALIDRNALDEERHYRWVTDVLDRLGVATADGAEIGVASRLREGMAKLDVDGLKERAGEAVGSARTRAAGGLDHAAERLDRLASAQVQSNPLRAVLATFAAGFIIGRILR